MSGTKRHVTTSTLIGQKLSETSAKTKDKGWDMALRVACALALAAAVMILAVPVACKGKGKGKGHPSLLPMKWAQDTKKVYFTVNLGCKSEVKFEPTDDTFALSCKDSAGKKQSVSLILREDIIVSKSSCSSAKGEEVCTLKKKHEHFWDRFPFEEEEAPNIKQDWSKWKAENEISMNEADPADAPYSTPKEAKYVESLKPAGLAGLVEKSSAVFVDVAFPWCNKCQFTRKAFASAAQQLGGNATSYGKRKPVSFAYVDALEDRNAARQFNVSCDFPCKFYVVHDGEAAHEEFEAKGQESDIVQEIEGRMAPVVTKVSTDEEVTAFSKSHAVAVFAYLNGGLLKGAKQTVEFAAVRGAAEKLRGKMAVMWSDKALAASTSPGIQLWVNGSDRRSVKLATNASLMARNLVAMSWGFNMFNYTYSKRAMFDSVGLPIAHVFLDDSTPPETVEVFESAAREVRGEVAFVRFKRSDSFMLKDFGLPEEVFPAFGVADSFDSKGKRYGLDDERLAPGLAKEIVDPSASKPEDWNDDNDGQWEPPMIANPEYTELRGSGRGHRFNKKLIVEFVQDYVAGRLQASYKSEPVPAHDEPAGKVRKVVWKNLGAQGKGVVEGDKRESVMLLLYKPWGPDIDKTSKVMDKLAEALGGVPEVRVAKMDTAKNHVDVERFSGIEEYSADPVVFLLAGDKVVRFKGSIGQSDLLKFVAKNVPEVKASWDAKVKPKLKEMKERAEEVRAKQRKEEEAKRLELEAERKRIDDILEKVDKQDLSQKKDGGIIKQIVSEGVGNATPTKGKKVTAHYTGTLLDGSKFDSSVDRNQPFAFTIGEGQVIPCWDEGFLTMKKGEKAFLTCTHEYAYGERGSPPKIPSKATLRFEVELISWEGDGGDGIKAEL
jgi:FKBP-type peptidyl-prolyl cis-trans isomerase